MIFEFGHWWCPRSLRLFAAAALVVLLASGGALAAPKADLWPRWQAHDPASKLTVDHRPWQAFLDRFILRAPGWPNRVRYAAVDAAAHKALKAYIAGLEAVPVGKLNRDAQRAYWINLYNAVTVDIILDHYPVTSIRKINISPGLFSRGPWGARRVRVEGTRVSLDDIEHRILRPIWKDARLHYALNCAAISCPELSHTAFTAKNGALLLIRGARRYVNNPLGLRIRKGKIMLSSIFFWYREDFGATDRDVLRHLITYARPRLARRLQRAAEVHDGGYDWSLNEAPKQ